MSHTTRAKKEAVLAAAGRLFGQKGYEATTMDEIAAAAGVSKATLYRYVSGKEELRVQLAPHLPDADMQARDARAAILEAAMDLMARQGFSRTTLDEIAAAAGVSKGAIYWHFKGKDDLLAAIIADYTPIPRISALLAGETGDLSVEELGRQVYEGFIDVVGPRVDFFRAVFMEVQSNPELGPIFQRNIAVPIVAALAGYIERGVRAGRLRPTHPMLMMQALIGPLMMHLLTRDLLERQLDLRFERREVVDTLLGIFFRGAMNE